METDAYRVVVHNTQVLRVWRGTSADFWLHFTLAVHLVCGFFTNFERRR